MNEQLQDVCSDEREKDLLDILLDSELYLELPLPERFLLLKHIISCYRSLAA
jgi:hypothetical protein